MTDYASGLQKAESFDALVAKPKRGRLEWAGRRIFVALIIALPSGMPLGLAGIDNYLSMQVQQVMIMLLAGFRLLHIFSRRWPTRWEGLVLAAIVYFYFATFISNTFFIPQPADGWLPGLIVVAPLLLIFVFDLFEMTAAEVIDGLLLATLSVALLLNIDRIVPISALNDFVHYSSRYGSARRIVLLHNEMGFAFTILLARAISAVNLGARLWSGAGLFLLAGPMFLVSESRLVIAASVIAAAIYVAVFFHSRIKVLYLAGILLLIAALSPLLIGFVVEYGSTISSLSEDGSAQFRNIEIAHFKQYFDQTFGFGFGLMSDSPNKPNIISNALYRDAALYGAPGYWMSLVDLRIYAALYQFGYIGLGFMLYLTGVCALGAWKLARNARLSIRSDYAALAAIIIGFMLSPLPLNLFTVSNTVTIGGCVIFLVARGQREHLAMSCRDGSQK